MRRAKRRNVELPKKKIDNCEECYICGEPERYPVARMIRGQVRWICERCWRENV